MNAPFCIYKENELYPKNLHLYLGEHVPKTVTAIGNLDILHNKKVGVCSPVKCPGTVILKTYNLMKKLRSTHD